MKVEKCHREAILEKRTRIALMLKKPSRIAVDKFEKFKGNISKLSFLTELLYAENLEIPFDC